MQLPANVRHVRHLRWFYILLIVSALAFWSYSASLRKQAEGWLELESEVAQQQGRWLRAHFVQFSEHAVPRGRTISDFLAGLGIANATIARVVDAARPVYDLSRVNAGHQLALGHGLDGGLRVIRYQIDRDRLLWVSTRSDAVRAEIREVPSRIETAQLTGTVRSSLFQAVEDAGESPELALRLADIFRWDLDFYTDPRPGDTFRAVLERKVYENGQPPQYLRLFVAEYKNAGTPFQAVLFRGPDGKPAYYTPEGKSLQKAFLKSPLRFEARITSGFSRNRFHPILKIHRPHLGIDYGAPIGAPVQTIGDGRVTFAGRQGGAGNLVTVKHSNGWETMYLHLSKILVRQGEHVKQGELVGRVGSTGHSTGPHLDFRIRENGQYRNFETLRLPPADPVSRRDWGEFAAVRDRWLPLLHAEPAQFARALSPATGPATAVPPATE